MNSQSMNAGETTNPSEAFLALRRLLDNLLSGTDATVVSSELSADIAKLARKHRLFPLIYCLSQRQQSSGLPAPLFAEAWARYEANAAANRTKIDALARIAHTLRSREIRFVCHKGAALARSLYADDAAREYSDIDLLLARDDIFLATDALRELGYSGGEYISTHRREAFLDAKRQYDVELYNAENGVALELHWRTDAQHSIGQPDVREWWESLDRVDLGNVTALQLQRCELMFALLIHGTKHQWERVAWLVDVVILARHFEASDWTWLEEAGRKRQCEIRLLFGLQLASALFPRSMPQGVQASAAAQRKLATLVAEARERLQAENDEATNVWASIARDLRCNDTFGQSLRQVALLAFTPNHHDWQHVGNHPLAGVTSFVSRLQRKLFWWRVKRTDARNS